MSNTPNTIAITEIILIDYDENNSGNALSSGRNDERGLIVLFHYKPTVDRDVRMEQHHKVQNPA